MWIRYFFSLQICIYVCVCINQTLICLNQFDLVSLRKNSHVFPKYFKRFLPTIDTFYVVELTNMRHTFREIMCSIRTN